MTKKVKNMFKNNMVLCVLVLAVIGITSVVFAADVTIKQGKGTFDELVVDTNALVVDPNGYVGIGTANPRRQLEVIGSAVLCNSGDHLNYLKVETEDDWGYFGVDQRSNVFIESANNGIDFYTEQDPPMIRMHITKSGNVGIGTLSPSEILDVNGNADIQGTLTMDDLVLPVKTTTGDPGSPVEGQIYVNTYDNKVRVYADSAWRDLATW